MNYPQAILANNGNDHRTAYAELSRAYAAIERQLHDAMNSRFIEVSKFDDNPWTVQKVTEESISQSVDMADCLPELQRKLFYLDDEGELQPVTIGKQSRTGDEFYYATAALLAAGREVGEVTYTDH